MKVLNLFAGLGGNRKFWDDVAREKGVSIEVTAVEFDPEIAKAYAKRYPNDNVIVGDAWDYAATNYLDFDLSLIHIFFHLVIITHFVLVFFVLLKPLGKTILNQGRY